MSLLQSTGFDKWLSINERKQDQTDHSLRLLRCNVDSLLSHLRVPGTAFSVGKGLGESRSGVDLSETHKSSGSLKITKLRRSQSVLNFTTSSSWIGRGRANRFTKSCGGVPASGTKWTKLASCQCGRAGESAGTAEFRAATLSRRSWGSDVADEPEGTGPKSAATGTACPSWQCICCAREVSSPPLAEVRESIFKEPDAAQIDIDMGAAAQVLLQ